ncbi:MAG: copper chaperone PCu(A)C [Anaerolineales bacterium]|nr:MAG: copper chaperone PCu(A)C [Anaerolineales bacterium]
MKRFALPFMLTVAVMTFSACAPSNSALTVQNAWARPARAGENGAAYFVIENGTASDDTLLSVSSDIATATEVHMSMMDGNGMMSMQMQETVNIPASKKVEFKAGGLHVMFIGLTRDLNIGDTITLILRFEKAGETSLQMEVKEQ